MKRSFVLPLKVVWFSIGCRNTKTNVIALANHKGHGQSSEPIKTRSNYIAEAKRGKTRTSESQLVLVSLLIG